MPSALAFILSLPAAQRSREHRTIRLDSDEERLFDITSKMEFRGDEAFCGAVLTDPRLFDPKARKLPVPKVTVDRVFDVLKLIPKTKYHRSIPKLMMPANDEWHRANAEVRVMPSMPDILARIDINEDENTNHVAKLTVNGTPWLPLEHWHQTFMDRVGGCQTDTDFNIVAKQFAKDFYVQRGLLSNIKKGFVYEKKTPPAGATTAASVPVQAAAILPNSASTLAIADDDDFGAAERAATENGDKQHRSGEAPWATTNNEDERDNRKKEARSEEHHLDDAMPLDSTENEQYHSAAASWAAANNGDKQHHSVATCKNGARSEELHGDDGDEYADSADSAGRRASAGLAEDPMTECRSMQARLAKLQLECKAEEARTVEAQRQRQAEEASALQARRQREEDDLRLAVLLVQCNDAEACSAQWEEKLSIQRAASAILAGQLSAREEELSALQKECTKLTKRRKAEVATLTRTQDSTAMLLKYKQEIRQENAQIAANHDLITREITRLTKELHEAKMECQDAKTESERYRREVYKLLDQQRSASRHDPQCLTFLLTDELQKQERQHKKEKGELNKQLAAKKHENRLLRSDLHEAHSAKMRVDQDVENLQRRMSRLESKLASKNDAFSDLAEKNYLSATDNSRLVTEIGRLTSEFESLQRALFGDN